MRADERRGTDGRNWRRSLVMPLPRLRPCREAGGGDGRRINLAAAVCLAAYALAVAVAGGHLPSAHAQAAAATMIASAAEVDPRLRAFEALIAGRHVREAIEESRKADLPQEVRLAWLRTHAQQGLPPFQSELAIHLLDADLDQALMWYARGYLATELDSAACAIGSGLRVPTKEEERVRLAGVANPERLLKAVDAAMAWAAAGVGVMQPGWRCEASLQDGSAKRRADAMARMELATIRLRRYVQSIDEGKRYPVRVRELEAVTSFYRREAGWIDNDTFMFVGRLSSAANTSPSLVHVWSIDKGTTSLPFGELRAREFCLREGRVLLSGFDHEHRPLLWEGTLQGMPVPVPVTSHDEVEERFEFCDPNTSHRRPDAPMTLRGGASVLPGDYASAARFQLPNGRTLSLPWAHGSFAVLDHSRWAGFYLVRGTRVEEYGKKRPSWGDDDELHAIAVADGSLSTYRVPFGIWTGDPFSALYRLSRLGLLRADGLLDEQGVPGWNGLFLFPFDGSPPARLIQGRFMIGPASPDGCRIPLATDASTNGIYLIRLLDICEGGRRAHQ